MKRKIIFVDEDRCTGCAECIPNCPEGALQVIDGKARLVSDLFCDGLGACVGHCPEGAMRVEEREAETYDEAKVMANIVRQGANTIRAHLIHLREHGEEELYAQAVAYLRARGIDNPCEGTGAEAAPHGGCPGSRLRTLRPVEAAPASAEGGAPQSSRLQNWPIQIHLANPAAPYFRGADLLLAADCAGFAAPDLHSRWLAGRVVVIGCPKLDDTEAYLEKLTAIFRQNELRSLTVLHMEVPCCGGLVAVAQKALARSGRSLSMQTVQISLLGEIQTTQPVSVS
jgi:ferredoxin